MAVVVSIAHGHDASAQLSFRKSGREQAAALLGVGPGQLQMQPNAPAAGG
jgi:hypothetical protein